MTITKNQLSWLTNNGIKITEYADGPLFSKGDFWIDIQADDCVSVMTRSTHEDDDGEKTMKMVDNLKAALAWLRNYA